MEPTSASAGSEQAGPRNRVYVVDDDLDVRKSLHFLLATSNIQTWPFASGADLIAGLPELEPAPILLDIRMPGIDGFGVMAELARRDIGWPLIVMTAHGDIPVAVRAMKQGAMEFLEKPFSAEELEMAVMRGFKLLQLDQDSRDRQTEIRHRFDTLTPREAEVIRALVKGAANKVVAHQFGLSTRTIEMHRASALTKLNVKSLAEVALLLASIDAAAPARDPRA